MRSLAILAVAISAVAAPASAPLQSGCVPRGARAFARLADLPPGAAAAATRIPMAERGARFQSGDAMLPGADLPVRRFVAARMTGCRLTLRYEQGGIAHTFQTLILELRGRSWRILSDS